MLPGLVKSCLMFGFWMFAACHGFLRGVTSHVASPIIYSLFAQQNTFGPAETYRPARAIWQLHRSQSSQQRHVACSGESHVIFSPILLCHDDVDDLGDAAAADDGDDEDADSCWRMLRGLPSICEDALGNLQQLDPSPVCLDPQCQI